MAGPTDAPRMHALKRWHSVSVHSVGERCPASWALHGERFLSRDAPSFPLQDCDRPDVCQCIYRKHDDRRTPGQALDHNGIPLPHPERRDGD